MIKGHLLGQHLYAQGSGHRQIHSHILRKMERKTQDMNSVTYHAVLTDLETVYGHREYFTAKPRGLWQINTK